MTRALRVALRSAGRGRHRREVPPGLVARRASRGPRRQRVSTGRRSWTTPVIRKLKELSEAGPAAQSLPRWQGIEGGAASCCPTSRTSRCSTRAFSTVYHRRRRPYAIDHRLAREWADPPLRVSRERRIVTSARQAAAFLGQAAGCRESDCAARGLKRCVGRRAIGGRAARSTRRWALTPLEGLVMGTAAGDIDPSVNQLPVGGPRTWARGTRSSRCSTIGPGIGAFRRGGTFRPPATR